jgi:hypothetical protein
MSEASAPDVSMSSGRLVKTDHPFLTEDMWDWILKLDAISGRESVLSILSQGPQVTHDRIASFRRYEDSLFDTVRSEMARMAADAAAKATPPVAPVMTYLPSPPRPPSPVRPKPVRIAISFYSGAESENLVFWLREVDLALDAGVISDPRQCVTFAMAHLKGRAKDWALTCETTQPGCFSSWPSLMQAMKNMFLPPNVSYRQRVAFLACKQFKRDLYTYVQELRQLRASMAVNTLTEDVMVTVMMEGLNPGPAKTKLFRKAPSTLEEAITIALREDYSHRQANGLPVRPLTGGHQDTSGPEPMDLSAVDSRALNVQCYTCQKVGHYQRDCPRNRGFQSRGGPRGRGRGRGQFRGRGGGRGQPSPAGNASSQ